MNAFNIILGVLQLAPSLISTFQKLAQDPAIQSAEHLLESFFKHNDPTKPNNPTLAG